MVVLVVLVVFLLTVGYSAYELIGSSPRSGAYSAGFSSNGTVAVTGSLSIANAGWYPLSGFTLSLRIQNASGTLLGEVTDGPFTLGAQAVTTVPIALSVPIAPNGAGASLLVADQFLLLGVWGNATYAYLFPVSVHLDQNRSWGAPFANLQFAAGTPHTANGSTVLPVTVSFSNHASFAEVGDLALSLDAANGTRCGGSTYSLNVAPGSFYYQTQNVVLAPGCSIAGGSAVGVFSSGGGTIVLPPEALP